MRVWGLFVTLMGLSVMALGFANWQGVLLGSWLSIGALIFCEAIGLCEIVFGVRAMVFDR